MKRWLRRLWVGEPKVTFMDEIFFSTLIQEQPFDLDLPIIKEFITLYKPEFDSAYGRISLLKRNDVKNFAKMVIQRFEVADILKRRPGDGKLVKSNNYNLTYDLGSYSAFIKYRERELNFPKYQRWVNGWLIFGAIFAGISPIITTLINNKMYKQPPTQVNVPSQFVQHTVVTLDSLSLSTLKHLMLKDTLYIRER